MHVPFPTVDEIQVSASYAGRQVCVMFDAWGKHQEFFLSWDKCPSIEVLREEILKTLPYLAKEDFVLCYEGNRDRIISSTEWKESKLDKIILKLLASPPLPPPPPPPSCPSDIPELPSDVTLDSSVRGLYKLSNGHVFRFRPFDDPVTARKNVEMYRRLREHGTLERWANLEGKHPKTGRIRAPKDPEICLYDWVSSSTCQQPYWIVDVHKAEVSRGLREYADDGAHLDGDSVYQCIRYPSHELAAEGRRKARFPLVANWNETDNEHPHGMKMDVDNDRVYFAMVES